jgi:tetratricopeptide (TPR) repeat protein
MARIPKLPKAGPKPDFIRRDLPRMAEYAGGLTAAEAEVREPFEEGRAAMAACQWNQAIDHFRQAQTEASRAELVPLHCQVGVCYYIQGRLTNALREFRESYQLADYQRDRRGQAAALNNAGIIRHEYEELDGAFEQFTKAFAALRDSGDQRLTATCLGNAGNVERERGQTDHALKSQEQALEISRRTEYTLGVVSALGNAASVYRDKGEFDRATELYREAARSAHQVGDDYGHGVILGGIGGVHCDRGDFKLALRYHEDALVVARRIGYRLGATTELGNIGIILEKSGAPTQAVPNLLEALDILTAIGVDRGEHQLLQALARCDNALGRNQFRELLRQGGLSDESAAGLLDRVDQTSRKRPWLRKA